METVRWLPISYGDRLANTAIRGVCPEYGEMRNEVAQRRAAGSAPKTNSNAGAWSSSAIALREKLFAGRPAVGETVRISGMRFTVIGTMDLKIQDSNYFRLRRRVAPGFPTPRAGDLWNTRYASVLVFEPIAPRFEKQSMAQVRAAVAKRQRFSATDERAIMMFGREQFRPIIDGITIGFEALFTFVGALTLGIGGVGLMNIMLVAVDERIREIGLRRALGARRRHIQAQFMAEALVLTIVGGVLGILLAYGLSAAIGTLPFYGPLYEDTSGKGDIHLYISLGTIGISTIILILVGLRADWPPPSAPPTCIPLKPCDTNEVAQRSKAATTMQILRFAQNDMSS